jgi:hypothetical protein
MHRLKSSMLVQRTEFAFSAMQTGMTQLAETGARVDGFRQHDDRNKEGRSRNTRLVCCVPYIRIDVASSYSPRVGLCGIAYIYKHVSIQKSELVDVPAFELAMVLIQRRAIVFTDRFCASSE